MTRPSPSSRDRSSLRVLLALLALLLPSALVHGALPPGYGGTLRFHGDRPLRLPAPDNCLSSLEASLAGAVYPGLYRIEDGRPIPELAAALPEAIDDRRPTRFRIQLRQGLRRHDQRPLRAADVVASIRRLQEGPAAHLLAAFEFRRGRPEIQATAPHTLEVSLRPGIDAAALFALPAFGIRPRPGIGAGPYRAQFRNGDLRLHHFRNAAGGAPFLEHLRVLPPTSATQVARALAQDEVNLSWGHGSLYGRAQTTAVGEVQGPLLLLTGPPRTLAAIASRIDRSRLARLGLRPRNRLHQDVAPGIAPSAAPPPRTIRWSEAAPEHASPLADALRQPIEAMLDEAGVRLVGASASDASANDALRIVTVPWGAFSSQSPARFVHAAAHAALGNQDAARALLRDPNTVAPPISAIVLGEEVRSVELQSRYRGAALDAEGRFRFESLHLPREHRR